MTLTTLALILLSVMISAVAQICLKLGMSSAAVQHATSSSMSDGMIAVATSPAVVGGLMLYGLGAVTWLFVLAKTDVTQAYPFVGLGFAMTLAIGYFFLAESVSPLRIVGVLLVMGGVALVSQS